ncbi:MAG: hypothetical protein AAFN93_05390 [Bacteroidota bacterium]
MIRSNLFLACVISIVSSTFFSCGDDDIMATENELINQVTLTFAPTSGGIPLVYVFSDPDGDGAAPATQDDIVLRSGSSYTLAIAFENTIDGEDITAEIREEDEEHMIFFGWTQGRFSVPGGDGNIGEGERDDPIVYADFDENLNPLGVLTTWVAGDAGTGAFTVLLKHQPGIKSRTSDSTDGETDVEITWNIEIEE